MSSAAGSDDRYATTRRHLHGVAETLIAGPQYRRFGTIRLGVRVGGFAGVRLPVAIVGTEFVWPDGRAELAGSARELAAAAGIDLGAPAGLYGDGSYLDPDEPLRIDPAAAGEIESWFTLGDEALREFTPDDAPVLWPEHFDLAVTVDTVGYGVSPGDSAHPAPYAYVGPAMVPDGEFWNAPFGALRELADVGTVVGLVEFFAEGASLAHR